jgi:succinate dehydrogenase / fumarate reductase cytochrome b subunit
MNWFTTFILSSIGKKVVMALTGLFLISFLLVHVSINALIFYNDGGKTFTIGAHIMATNPIIRTIEIVLILGFVLHIIQGFLFWNKNRRARQIKYAVTTQPAKSPWYSRSMMLLGTLILLFLVIHTSNFWIPNRVHQFKYGEELPLYQMMLDKFQNPVEVGIYLVGCFSLYYHLLHGFQSSLRSLGVYHFRLGGAINLLATSFSVIVPFTLAMMPISIYLGWIK